MINRCSVCRASAECEPSVVYAAAGDPTGSVNCWAIRK